MMRGLEIDLTLYTHREICRYSIISCHNDHLFHEVHGIVQLVLRQVESGEENVELKCVYRVSALTSNSIHCSEYSSSRVFDRQAVSAQRVIVNYRVFCSKSIESLHNMKVLFQDNCKSHPYK